MGEPAASRSPRVGELDREFDRENETASWPAPTASSLDREDREFRASRSVDRENHGLAAGREVPVPAPWGDEQDDEHTPSGGLLAPIQDLRFVRQSPKTTTDKIAFAIHGAYALPQSHWRTANIIFAYTVATPGHIVCDAIKWALFDRLSRTLLAVPVLIALAFVLNQVPIVEWLIPDQWDISNAFPHDTPVAPGSVEVPIEAPPVGEG